jgi:hypothetical protein
MVNIVGTSCYNTMLVYIFKCQLKFNVALKQGLLVFLKFICIM